MIILLLFDNLDKIDLLEKFTSLSPERTRDRLRVRIRSIEKS